MQGHEETPTTIWYKPQCFGPAKLLLSLSLKTIKEPKARTVEKLFTVYKDKRLK